MSLVEMETVPSSGGNRSDESLLRRFRTGDDDAATALYRRYAKRLLGLARNKTAPELAVRFDAEDVVQSVFRTFFRRAAQGLYNVPPGEELWQLFLVLALNKIRKLALRHRAGKRDVQATVQNGAATLEFASGTDDDAVSVQILRMVIQEVIAELPDYQQVIVLDRIDGYGIPEIATRTARSKRTVERTLQQFRQKLTRKIDDGD
jgi:RNA polymerase sigma-70 factor (ECF subfamily)